MLQHAQTQSDIDSFDRDSTKAIASSVILGTVGASTILVMPGLLGVIVNTLQLNEKQLGFVASVDVFTMALALGVSAIFISHFSWRTLSVIGLIILALGNFASLMAENYQHILWARGLAGIGEGITVAVSFAAFGVTRDPDRSFGIYLVFALLFSSAVLYAFPFFVAWGGETLVFLFLISLCIINLFFIPWLTPSARPKEVTAQLNVPVSSAVVGLGLLMVTLFFIAQGAVWSYLERIGFSHGIDAQTVGTALALSALSGIVGAAIAMFVGTRYARSIPITVGIIVQIISMLMLTGDMQSGTFIFAVMLFNFSWNLCQPYFSGIMSEVDPQGRVVVLMGAIQTAGVAIGPFIAALIISPGHLEPIGYLGILCLVATLAITFVLLNRWHSHRAAFLSVTASS